MSSAIVADKVKKIVVDFFEIDQDRVTPDASLVDDLEADSLDMIELVMAIEEEFDIEIPDGDAEDIVTVQDAVSYVEDRMGE